MKDGFNNFLRYINALVVMRLYRILNFKSRLQLFNEVVAEELKQQPIINVLFPKEKLRKHYVYGNIRNTFEHPDLSVTQIRYFRLYEYFKNNFPDVFDNRTRILNVGDTSGVFFEGINRKGTSLNINKECVDYIRSKGIEAVVGNAENINFSDRSFDYVFSFQCLEHIPNPIKALNEFGRLAGKKVFISIPYTRTTKIYDMEYWTNLRETSWKEKSVRGVDCHIFEFSTTDFKNILTYTNLRYESSWLINYFSENSLKGRLLNNYFRSYFNFFVLQPVAGNNNLHSKK